MVKKLFALASVSALAGLVSAVGAAGCSSTTTESPATGTDSGIDAAKKGDAKAGPGDDDDDTADTGPSSCVDTTPIDATKYPYKTPVATANACTTKELSDLSAYFKKDVDAKTDTVMSEWAKVVSPACATCVFSDGSGATWTPIITKDDKFDEVNRGGCIELASGKPACGKDYQQVTDCRLDACASKCTTQDDFDACLQDPAVFDGPCKDAITALQTDCGSSLGAFEDACKGTDWTFEGPIKAQCITGSATADAGDGGM